MNIQRGTSKFSIRNVNESTQTRADTMLEEKKRGEQSSETEPNWTGQSSADKLFGFDAARFESQRPTKFDKQRNKLLEKLLLDVPVASVRSIIFRFCYHHR